MDPPERIIASGVRIGVPAAKHPVSPFAAILSISVLMCLYVRQFNEDVA